LLYGSLRRERDRSIAKTAGDEAAAKAIQSLTKKANVRYASVTTSENASCLSWAVSADMRRRIEAQTLGQYALVI